MRVRNGLGNRRADPKAGKATRTVAEQHAREPADGHAGPTEQPLQQREQPRRVAARFGQLGLDQLARRQLQRDGCAVGGGIEREPGQSASRPRSSG